MSYPYKGMEWVVREHLQGVSWNIGPMMDIPGVTGVANTGQGQYIAAIAKDSIEIAHLIASAPELYEACGLYWEDDPDTHHKIVYTREGKRLFETTKTGLSGAAEAIGFMKNRRQAAIAKAEGKP